MKKKLKILALLLALPLVLSLALSGCATNPPRPGFSIFGNKPAPNKNLKEYTADLTRNNFKTYHFLDNTVLVSKPVEYSTYFGTAPEWYMKPPSIYSFYKISHAYYRECKNLGGKYKNVINVRNGYNDNINKQKGGYATGIPKTTSLNRFVIAAIKNNEKNKFNINILYKIRENSAYHVCSQVSVKYATLNCGSVPDPPIFISASWEPYPPANGHTIENVCLRNNKQLIFRVFVVKYLTLVERVRYHYIEYYVDNNPFNKRRIKVSSAHYHFYPANIFAVAY